VLIAPEQPTRLTLAELLDRAAARYAGETLYRWGDETCRCSELRDASERVARGLAAQGLSPAAIDLRRIQTDVPAPSAAAP
jgi:non-ribosomal peptide synthetase component E (peptide arylation enzyme)